MKFLALSLIVFVSSLATQAWSAQFYSDRPHISQVRNWPDTDQEQRKAVSEQYLESLVDFVTELRIFHGDKRRVYLARDGESIYEIDWLLWETMDNGNPRTEPILLNVSSKSVLSPILIQYLHDGPLFDFNLHTQIFIDTGYEATVVDGINDRLTESKKATLGAFLISSTHGTHPSSRVSTVPYFPEHWSTEFLLDSYKESFLDLVDKQIEQIEAAAHFTSSATEYRKHPRTGKMDAYSPNDATPLIQENSRIIQIQIDRFVRRNSSTLERAQQLIDHLRPIVSLLKEDPGLYNEAAIKKAYAYSRKKDFTLFWTDLREVYAKGAISAQTINMQRLWRDLPGGRPALFDLEPEEMAQILEFERARETETAEYVLAAAAPAPLFIEEIMAFHKSEKSPAVQKQRKNELNAFRQASAAGIAVGGQNLKVGPCIDEGCRGEVFDLSGDYILKVPFEADDMRYITVEAWVSDYLTEHFDRYQIRVLPILSRGKNGTYLVRRKLAGHTLGQHIASRALSGIQLQKLQKLFESCKHFAKDTGVGLDIKYDNIAWIDDEWIIFDTGPRTSFGPYAMTLDITTFDDFLRLWQIDEPRKNGLSIEALVNAHNCRKTVEESIRQLK